MAIVEATRELEPHEKAGIGWGGKRLDEMLAESERRFDETGSYCGLDGRLELKESDPIGYEKLFSRVRGGLVSARETAMNISASPIVVCSRSGKATLSKTVSESRSAPC